MRKRTVAANPFRARLERLTPRERQVLELSALGLTNTRIAERLGVSVHAVKFHLSSIFRKLGVTNRTEAAVAYLRLGDRIPAGSAGKAARRIR